MDYDGERMEIFTGLSVRPRIVISTGNSLLIRFNANGGIGTGFNAAVNFFSKKEASDSVWNPETGNVGVN